VNQADTIISTMLRLHDWRYQHNGNRIGFGIDPYEPDEKFHYAEAYAIWGQGYLSLYQLTGVSEYLDCARKAGEWLSQNTNPGYGNPSWGLPWRWERWDTSATLSYLITTVFVGEFFLKLYSITSDQKFLDFSEQIVSWIIDENGGEEASDGRWLYYANHPGLKIPVVNPSIKTAGFLARLQQVRPRDFYREYSLEIVRWTINQQHKDGSWYYSPFNRVVDNFHSALNLEGLTYTYSIFRDLSWWRNIQKGFEFYWRHLFNNRGKGRSRSIYTLRGIHKSDLNKWLRDQIARFKVRDPISESRLWSYGGALRVFSLASQLEESWMENALCIYRYITNNLLNSDGSFAYKRFERQAFIRHEAHIFDGLGLLANMLRDRLE
jgi:hypothetical protein